MIGRSQFCWSVACVVVLATLVPAGRLMAAGFSDGQYFNNGTLNTLWIPGPLDPYWSVDGGCSAGLLFKDGVRGDNGSNCLTSVVPVGVGTRMIRDLNPGPGSSTIGEMKQTEQDTIRRLFLSADDGSGKGQELCRLVGPLYPVLMLEKDINPGAGSSSPADMRQWAPGGIASLYFSADDGTNGRELWLSSTSNALIVTTAMLKDINPGAGSSNPSGFSSGPAPGGGVAATMIFAADDGTNGRELWKTDGTGPNTLLVQDINTNAGVGSDPQLLTSVIFVANTDIKVFFTADDGVNGRELWRSDGTLAGTGLVKDIVAGATGSNPTNLTAGNPLVAGVATPTLFFTVDSDGVNGQELWKSRGALGGADTVQVYDPGAAGNPTNLTNVSGLFTLFFTVGNDLWKSDGSTAGTVLVKTFASPPANLVSATSLLYLAADDGTGSGVELWKADATGATLAKDINPGAGSSSPTNLFAMGGSTTVYFSADDGTNGRELWRSDATAGALLIKDINPGAASSNPSQLTYFDGTLVFTADDGTHGRELWQSDGFADPSHAGMSYKWDLSSLIQSKGDVSKVAFACTNANPLSMYWLHDFPQLGGSAGVSEGAHQVNTYVEITDGTDRVPLTITNVDCGDGNVTRPKAALTDGTNHNAFAFGMVAVLDQTPCDTDIRGPGSPNVPFAYVPSVYDGHDWIPMDMAHLCPPSGTCTAAWAVPPTTTGLWQGSFAYRQTGYPGDLVPATTDPWSTKRFTYGRLDVYNDYLVVTWASKQNGIAWVAAVPRHYTGGFKSLYLGNKACQQPAYPFYFDTLVLNGGFFTSSVVPHGACCQTTGLGCTDVSSEAECSGRYRPWRACNDPTDPFICCPYPFADADFDGDVDQDDFGAFQICYTGAGGGVPPGCVCFDRAKDNDVDLDDYTLFSNCFTGPNVPWSAGLTPSCVP